MITVKRASELTKTSTSTINRLIRDKKLKGEKVGRSYQINHTVVELKELVEKNVTKHGWKQNRSNGIGGILELARIPTNKRKLILKIADKFSVDELKLILSL